MSLRCERNEPEIDAEVLADFNAEFGEEPHKPETFFEHGQWFVQCKCGAQWSANDAELANGDEVFCFEQVSDCEDDFHE